MDLDAFVAAHAAQWRELETLTARGRLSAPESERLVELYQAVATHLSVLRTNSPDPALVVSLSSLLARARRRAGRDRAASFDDLTRFFTHTFPAALYRLRRWWITVAVASLAVAFALGAWIVAHPEREHYLATPQEIEQLVNHDFENYYSDYAASHFALQVWTNNAFLAVLAVALGVLGVPVVLMLWSNVVNLGLMGGLMTLHHKGPVFWTLILPHGLLELTAVFIAVGVGLRLFWSWVEPGHRTRAASVAHEGRTTVMVGLGLVAVLAVSGLLEAFITPSPLPSFARITIGAIAWLAFLYYALVLGRRRVREGFDGDLASSERAEDSISVD